jgi:hypothetical protein
MDTPFLPGGVSGHRWRRHGADDGNFDRPILISVTPVSTPGFAKVKRSGEGRNPPLAAAFGAPVLGRECRSGSHADPPEQ